MSVNGSRYSEAEKEHWASVTAESLRCLPESHRELFSEWMAADDTRIYKFREGWGGRLELLKEYRLTNNIVE